MKQIPVWARGQVVAIASVDDEDADLLLKRWRPDKDGYARYSIRRGALFVDMRMHRVVFSRVIGRELLPSECIDHIDRNVLNNRRSNLRIASKSLNSANRSVSRVTWHKGCRKWQSVVVKNRRCHYGGVFADRQEAEKRSKELVRELWPEII